MVEIKPTNRSKRSIKDTYTEPRTLDLAFQIEGSPVNLHLERNDGVNTNLPVTVFENGNLRKRSLQDEEVIILLYLQISTRKRTLIVIFKDSFLDCLVFSYAN